MSRSGRSERTQGQRGEEANLPARSNKACFRGSSHRVGNPYYLLLAPAALPRLHERKARSAYTYHGAHNDHNDESRAVDERAGVVAPAQRQKKRQKSKALVRRNRELAIVALML